MDQQKITEEELNRELKGNKGPEGYPAGRQLPSGGQL